MTSQSEGDNAGGQAAPASGAAPWDVRDIALPRYVTASWVDDIIGTPEGDDLVRANIVSHSKDQGQRIAWKVLWQTISFDTRWRQHVSSLLRADRRHTKQALADGLQGKAAGRARDYLNNIDGALARIRREAGGPLAWGPARYAKYSAEAREDIEYLALSIAEHRAGTLTNEELYAVLADLGLDPEGRQVPGEAWPTDRER
ncbi:hypothetical protein [Mycolicibacterium fortuitum]|uniref:hypothetical protein n=1 Tax=Mycolicibacterium fortuitum TaxID=1766 RepID=UPI003AAE4CC5